jgi:hypothetical protein
LSSLLVVVWAWHRVGCGRDCISKLVTLHVWHSVSNHAPRPRQLRIVHNRPNGVGDKTGAAEAQELNDDKHEIIEADESRKDAK